MLPQQAEVLLPWAGPAAVITHESRIEGVNLRRRHDLSRSMGGEGPQDMNEVRAFQNGEIIDGLAADLAGPRESSGLEQPSALGEQQFGKPFEGMSPFQPKQGLNVFRPVGIHPFLERLLWYRRPGEKGRKPSMQQSVAKIGLPERRKIFQHHRCQPDLGFPSGQGVAELTGRSEGRGAGRNHFRVTIVIGGDLE